MILKISCKWIISKVSLHPFLICVFYHAVNIIHIQNLINIWSSQFIDYFYYHLRNFLKMLFKFSKFFFNKTFIIWKLNYTTCPTHHHLIFLVKEYQKNVFNQVNKQPKLRSKHNHKGNNPFLVSRSFALITTQNYQEIWLNFFFCILIEARVIKNVLLLFKRFN
jgi:hypothetical protein